MVLIDLCKSKIKINTFKNKSFNKYIVEYPKKNCMPVDMSMNLLKNVINESDVIIQIDSNLTFLNENDTKDKIKKLRNILANKDINAKYRASKCEEKNSFAGIVLGKKYVLREELIFRLYKGIDDEELLKIILNIGCFVYVPMIEIENNEILDKILNGYFEDNDEKFLSFKVVMYINSYVDRASIETKILDIEEIKKYI
ncbi:hypothetical protein SAMN05443428_10864 [Caloramator quimbayensis]|uniref:Uncharacterized protein n=1 Tax=Caloramator quimbayensis TaxID=1147123 RepID=A0A1T4XFJ4_9CLOT|nr:hypothetical protein [Caloramator quimbayensis]SKA87841.1 hypothetical protein SAMN05443428_10864 [Caloramator quimbayensis]